MPSQEFFSVTKEAVSLTAYCEESLLLMAKHLADRTLDEDAISLGEIITEDESWQHHATKRQTRAFAEEVLRALAARYAPMTAPDSRSLTLAIGE
jgi:hypothetical protein